MFKFFRRSKNKNASTKDATTSNKTQNKQNTNSTTEFNQQQHHPHHHNQTLQKQIDNVDVKLAENACAIFNADVINKTDDNVENYTVSHSNDCGVAIVNVLVENVTNIDVSSSENQNNLKKDISSRNEIVDQIQCRNKNVSEGSIPISIDQFDKKQKDHNHHQHDEQYCCNQLERRDLNVRKIKFNPLNKSREFFNGIMAKGRNRHRNRNNNNNNKDNNNKQSKSQQDHPQQVSTKEVVKLSDRLEVDPVVVGAVGAAGGCVHSDPPAHKDLNPKENFPFGYQITKSKNSKNLVMRFAEGEDLNEKSDEDRCDDPSSSSTSTSDIDASATDSSNNTDEFCASANTVNTYENRIKQDEDRNDHQHYNNEDRGAQYVDVSHVDGVVTKNYSDHIENVKNDDDHDNNDNATASSFINSPIQSILLNTNKNLCDEDENCERQYPQNDSFSVQLKNDDVEDISELTDSDRVNLLLKIDMGQPISKEGSSATNNLLSTNTCNLTQLNNNNNKYLIIPTITVADYSDRIDNNEKIVHHNDTTDIFYDSEENFDTETDHQKISINTAQEAFKATDLNNDLNEINNVNNNNINNNNNEWHFVTNNNNNSDLVKIEDDPDDRNEKNLIFNSNSENISTTSLSTSDNNNKAYLNSDSDNIETIDNRNLLVIDSRTINNDSGINLNFDSEESFLRGNSTDCDDNLIQSDYEIIYDHENVNNNSNNNNNNNNNKNSSDHHIIIDSISLPDVVVESTGMGSSHSNLTVRTDSVEDNTVDNSTIINNDDHNDNNKRDLVNQEAHFSTQIQEAQKIAFSAQTKANELQYKIDELERELSVKSWNVDRLQTELQALHKEDEGLRKRLRNIEEEKHSLRQKLSETEEELKRKHDELQTQYNKLQEKCRDIQSLVTSLKAQLAFAQSNVDQIRSEKEKLRTEKDEELKKLQESLDKSNQEKKEQEVKWQKEFEKLRTQNADQEEHLMSDCEWKLRTMQKNCKEKLDAAEKAKKEALARAAEVEAKAVEQTDELQRLRCCEPEIKSLRGLTEEQRQSIMIMTEQVEELKEELESANQRLEDQIEAVRKIKFQCNNALCDKDRHMIQKIDEARYDVAMQWEEKLLTEMTRLTTELNTVHGDERNDAVRKLQEEHLEEIRALTTRYNANEEELREEVEKLKNEIKMKDKKYKDLQTKTDSALLETRLHLERADRDYQCAMNREDEKRERLCETMKKEFDIEKKDMEEQFRQRINQVKDEFARELANTTEEMAITHRKQLEHQWEQLIQEKEEALQAMETRHRIRLEEAENRIKDLEIEHQRDLKELKNNFDIERTTLESRDHQNNQEIEQLHRKCRCLTNLFEEMRVRYERRDPRPEDLRDIDELRSRCESQERDLHILTERLREMQIQIADQMQVNNNNNTNAALGSKKSRVIRKPPPKTIPTNCDVIYEENEERDSPMKEHCSEVNGTNKTAELIEDVAAES